MRIYNADIVGTAGLADGAVTDVKVNAAASIGSAKLNLGDIAQNLYCFPGNTYDIGDSFNPFRDVYVGRTLKVQGVDIMAFTMINAHLSQE